MFERFVRLARARKALKDGQLEQAVKLTEDPMVRAHRRAETIRRRALDQLLARARRRAEGGQWSAALADASRVMAFEPEHDGAQSLAAEVREHLQGEKESARTARELFDQARKQAEQGELQAADELRRQAAELGGGGPEARHLEQFVAGRRDLAREHLARAEQCLGKGDLEAAREACAQARGLDNGAVTSSPLPRRLARKLGAAVASAMARLLKKGELRAAYEEYQRHRRQLPELEDIAAVRARVADLATALRKRLAAQLDDGNLETAVKSFLGNDPRLLEEPEVAAVVPTARGLLKAVDLEARGQFRAAGKVLEGAADELGAAALRRRAKALDQRAAATEGVLAAARALAAEGKLTEARAGLTRVLEDHPMHEAVRREIDLLDQGAVDRDQRMARARELAREGMLREASAMALTLAVSGASGEEARLLLKEVQARMDLVAQGLDEVRMAVHGRDSGSAEGLRHSILRLEQLATQQADHPDLPPIRAALEAEVEGLLCFDRAVGALAAGDQRQAAGALAEVAAMRGRLLAEDRLDARILDLADRICSWAEESARHGQLTAAGDCVDALQGLKTVQPELAQRLDALGSALAAQRQRGDELAHKGRELLAAREVAEAEDCLSDARNVWVESPAARELERGLTAVREQEARLVRVEELAREADYEGAQRQLSGLPPTPPALRTRIFDMKKDLARVQGLGDGFILRVDEGGEFLVLRGDSISIGNLRDGKSDLPVLANIAGRHARIQRTMSFHGGLQDNVIPEKGEVRVAGRPVDRHRLKAGEVFQLGKNLSLSYGVPSGRSLTARLTLQGGFQVAGTDQILLMKDRGRDGRILIGAGDDVHVRVPEAAAEVEIFADPNGQVRLRYEGRGTMDGKPFSGEHPVSAGVRICCGPVSLVLTPWSRTL